MEIDGFANVAEILKCGVYLLVRKGQVVYVGRSKSMLSRIYSHRIAWQRVRKGLKPHPFLNIKGMLFDEILIQPCHPDKVKDLELQMIAKYRPKHNIVGMPKNCEPFVIHVNGIELQIGGILPHLPKEEPLRRRSL